MANTMTKIASYTAPSNVTQIQFTSIPQTYKDLMINISARTDYAANSWNDLTMYFNGVNSGVSFNVGYLVNGSATGGYSSSWAGWTTNANAATNEFGSNNIYISNYTSSNYKSWIIDTAPEPGSTAGTAGYILGFAAGLWSNTSAISSFVISTTTSSNIVAGSEITLYGI